MEVKQRDGDIVMTFQVKAWMDQVLCGKSSIPYGISAEGSDEDVFAHTDEDEDDEHDKEDEEDDEEKDEDKA